MLLSLGSLPFFLVEEHSSHQWPKLLLTRDEESPQEPGPGLRSMLYVRGGGMGSREEEDMNSWSSHLFIWIVRPVGDPQRQVLELINLFQMA